MKFQNIIKGSITVLTVTLLFSGCGKKIEVNKQVGNLNLSSQKLKQQPSTNLVISVVSPKIKAEEDEEIRPAVNSFQALAMQRMQNNSVKYNFNANFSKNYAQRLDKALSSAVSEIISSKGFKQKGPYSTFDDMTYRDKKATYLAFVPKIDFVIDNKIISQSKGRLSSHTEGVIQIGGEFIISMVEPMTGQVFIKRRINLSDLNIEEHYIYDKQFTESNANFSLGGAVSAGLDQAMSADKLVDTTDVALTNAINKFYKGAIKKINAYLDREEILSFKKDILKLKGLKRF